MKTSDTAQARFYEDERVVVVVLMWSSREKGVRKSSQS